MSDPGAAAVEFAIILPLLLLLIGGIVDFGRVMYVQNIVTNAAREGARARALGYDESQTIARVNAALFGNTTMTSPPGINPGPACPVTPTPSDQATVALSYPAGSYDFLILPLTPPVISATAVMRCGG